ncbi:MAG TPA: hypothetical protein VII45_05505 [Solirubrobacterales bacterium]
MKKRSHSATLKVVILSAATAVVALAAFGPGLATGAYGPTETTTGSTTSTVPTVYIKLAKGKLQFEAPKTVVEGEELRVVNTTNPKQVGPHTFSLVEPGSIPKTANARKLCFTPGHICKAIAAWHGVKGNGPPSINPVEVGAEGWSTLGSLTSKGDSWFTGSKPGTSIVQRLSAGATAGPTTIYFMCAIHPWMHGKITVLPAS